MTFKLTILGSSSALPTVNKYPSAHVLNVHEQFYLIDAGEGVQTQLRRYGISSMKIDHIFISHMHGDHVYGIFGLLSTMSLIGRERHLHIYAPAPFSEMLESHFRFFNIRLTYPIVYHNANTKVSEPLYENKVMSVYSIPMKHKIATSGFLFKEKTPPLNVKKYMIEKHALSIADIASAKRGEDIILNSGELLKNDYLTYVPYVPRSFAYCSDTAFSKKVVETVRGVDLLYHESTFLDTDKKMAKSTSHSTASDAARVAKEAEVGKLVLGHFSHRYDGNNELFENEARAIFENSVAASEGDQFEVIPK